MPLTRRACDMLRAYHAGELSNSVSFYEVLGQAQLDYTPASLERIDQLLRQMHTQLKPEFAAFMSETANSNFISVLAFYIGTLMARFTLQRVEWYPYEELSQILTAESYASITPCFQSAFASVFFRDDQRTGYFFPLSAIYDILFEGDSSQTLAAGAEAVLHRALSLPLLQAPGDKALATEFASDHPGTSPAEGVHRLGLLVGRQVAMACRTSLQSGDTCAPQIHHVDGNGQNLVQDLRFYSPDEAFPSARQRLEEPEPGISGSAFCHDGYINLPHFRSDTLVIEARWYSPDLRISIAVPYRNANLSPGFALHSPRVLESSFHEGFLSVFEAAFFAGMGSINPPGLWADHYVDEASLDNLTIRLAEQEAAAYPAADVEADPFAGIRFDALDVPAGIAALSPEESEYIDIPSAHLDQGLREMVENMPALLREGRVVWGFLIQANKSLFTTGPRDEGLPGSVLYDPAGKLTPSQLSPIARTLFASRTQIDSLRVANPPQPERLRIAEYLRDEFIRALALPLPATDGDGELLVTTIYFVRSHLFTEKIVVPYFPLLILDRLPGMVMVLPSRWWPEELLAMAQKDLEVAQTTSSQRSESVTEDSAPVDRTGRQDKAYTPDPELAHLNPFSITEEGFLWFSQKNYARALLAWTEAAAAGSSAGIYGLATLYENGLGVPKDMELALKYYENAAAQDHYPASKALARIRLGDKSSDSFSADTVSHWTAMAVEGFKARKQEEKICDGLIQVGCPLKHVPVIVNGARIQVRRLRYKEGCVWIVNGALSLFFAYLSGDGGNALALGGLGVVLASFGVYKLITGERGVA